MAQKQNKRTQQSERRPSRLTSRLATLAQELLTWSRASSDFDTMAAHDLKQEDELVAQADHRAKITANQLVDSQEMVKKVSASLTRTNKLCTEALCIARQTSAELELALDRANSTLQYWEAERASAQTRLAQALEWVTQAKVRLQAAQANSAEAARILHQAADDLRACRKSTSRISCWTELVALQQAQEQVGAVYAQEQAVEQEVRLAEQTVKQTHVRITACTQAIEYAREAIHLAKTTIPTAQQGADYAERSLENRASAQAALQETQQALQREEEAVAAMIEACEAAKTSISEAKKHFKSAEYHEDAASRHALHARQDLCSCLASIMREGNRERGVDTCVASHEHAPCPNTEDGME